MANGLFDNVYTGDHHQTAGSLAEKQSASTGALKGVFMANITLNIEGDLNIYVSEEDGQPDSLYLDGMDGFPETLRIHLEADGEDDESKAEVIYAIPGAAAISMTLYEALSLALNSGGADSLELMPVSGIFIAFNSDDVIIDQNGDCYLAGPGIIFALEDGDIVSLDEEDKELITQVLEDGTAELTNGAEIRCAFGL